MSLPRPERSHILLSSVSNFIEAENFQDSFEVCDVLNKFRSDLLNPSPLKKKSQSATDRQAILSGRISEYPNLELTSEQRKELLNFSDDMNLNELECLNLWIEVSMSEKRRWLESKLGIRHCSLDKNIPTAARALFAYEKDCIILTLYQLLRARRLESTLSEDKRRVIIRETNKLLCNGLTMTLMESIKSGIVELQTTNQTYQVFVVKVLRQLTECLFLAFYETQIEPLEADALLQLVREVAELQVSSQATTEIETIESESALSTGQNDYNASTESNNNWKLCLNYILVVLQLTQVCAFDQTHTLLSRHMNDSPYCNTEGNGIIPRENHKEGLDNVWKNRMAKGFTCFVYAILRQPYVDMGEMSPQDVIWFLREASYMQAYSYVRVCMIPILQSETNNENQILFVSVLCELVNNLLTIFSLPVYQDVGFPFPHKSKVQHRSDELWSSQQRIGNLYDPQHFSHPELLLRDCQDDVIDLITSLIRFQSSMAESFWKANSSQYHPFVSKVFEGSLHDSALVISATKFLTALASAPNESTCESVYNFVRNKLPGKYDWVFFMRVIDMYTTQLNPNAAASQAQQQMLGSMNKDVPIVEPRLSPQDSEGLNAIIQLLAAVMRQRTVVQAFISQGFQPVQKLFALLACPISSALKGSILHALASLCGSFSPYLQTQDKVVQDDTMKVMQLSVVDEVWKNLEMYRLLPTSGAMAGGYSGRHASYSGLQYELEAVESVTGVYPVTDGFLTLLNVLLQDSNGTPTNLGLGYRVPGVTCYVEYVINEILLKAHVRNYHPDNTFSADSQRWRICCKAIKILTTIIQQYHINSVSVDQILALHSGVQIPMLAENSLVKDFTDETVSYAIDTNATGMVNNTGSGSQQMLKVPRPKSIGFVVMTNILHRTRYLLHFLCEILSENQIEELDFCRETERNIACSFASDIMLMHSSENVDIKISQRIYENDLNMNKSQQLRQLNYGSRTSIDNANSMLDENRALIELPEMDWDRHIFDHAYWKQKTVSNVISLLYECSLRESNFMKIIRSSPPLSIVQSNANHIGTSTLLSVQLSDLSDSLSSTYMSSTIPLSNISNFIVLNGNSEWSECFPSVPVMAIRIIQHVATSQTSLHMLNIISDAVFVGEIGSSSDQLTFSCTAGLKEGNLGVVRRPWSLKGTCVAKGWERPFGYGDIHTPSYAHTFEPLSESLQGYLWNKVSGSASEDAHMLENRSEDDVREAILDLLLVSFMPNKLCLCHQLLGLKEAVELSIRTGTTFQIINASSMLNNDSKINFPLNCLDAILDIITPYANSPFNEIFTSHPEQIMKILELLYRLCSSPLTSTLTLASIRKRSFSVFPSSLSSSNHHFFEYHLQLLIEEFKMHQNLSVESSTAVSITDVMLKELNQNQSRNNTKQQDMKLRATKINCCAWILKIIALELHTLELTPNIPSSKISEVLSVLYDAIDGSSSSPIIMQLLQFSPLSENFNMDHNDTPLIIQCITECCVPYSVCYSKLPASNNVPPSGFNTIDMQRFQSMLRNALMSHHQQTTKTMSNANSALFNSANANRNEYYVQQQQKQIQLINSVNHSAEQGAAIAVDYSLYNMLMAANANMCQAWRQVIDTSLLGCGYALLGIPEVPQSDHINGAMSSTHFFDTTENFQNYFSSIATSFNKLFSSLILPTIELLVMQSSMEMILAEQVARSLLSMVSVVRSISWTSLNVLNERNSAGSTHKPSNQNYMNSVDQVTISLISTSHFDIFIDGLIRAILRRGNAQTGVSRNTSSCVYRGTLYTCFIHILRCINLLELNGEDSSLERIYSDKAESSLNSQLAVRCVQLLAPYVTDLCNIISYDAVTASNTWKLVSLSMLSTLMSILGPANKFSSENSLNASKTYSFIQSQQDISGMTLSTSYSNMLNTIHTSGHLENILSAVGLSPSSPITAAEIVTHGRRNSDSKEAFELGLFQSVISLCGHIACTKEGAMHLLDIGMLGSISLLPALQVPTSASKSNIASGSGGVREGDVEAILAPLLRLLLGLAASSKSRYVIQECCDFLLKNQAIISYYCDIDCDRALDSLRITHLIVSLMCVIAETSTEPGYSTASDSNTNSSKISMWDSCLGAKGDAFTHDLCNLLNNLTSNPCKFWTTSYTRGNKIITSRQNKSWWKETSPSPRMQDGGATSQISSTRDESLKQLPLPPPNCLKSVLSEGWIGESSASNKSKVWSKYDGVKFMIGMWLMERISSFLRIRCDMWVGIALSGSRGLSQTHSNPVLTSELIGLVSVEVTDISFAFQSLARFYLRICDPSRIEAMTKSWLTSSHVVLSSFSLNGENKFSEKGGLSLEVDMSILSALLHCLESLLTSIHDLSSLVSFSELSSWNSELQGCIALAESFPPHSFIRQISKCIRSANMKPNVY